MVSIGGVWRYALIVCLVLFFAWPSSGLELVPLPPQPEDVAWPTYTWLEGVLPDDLDRKAFDESVEALFASKGRGGYADTRALLVVQGGKIVFERYADGFGPDSRFQSWSMAKYI